MFEGLDRRQRFGALGIGVIALFVVGLIGAQYLDGPKSFPLSPQGAAGGASPARKGAVHVKVAGQVAKPGEYTFAPGSKVADAIRAAGGATETGDTLALSLDTALVDGTTVTVPKHGTPLTGDPYAKRDSSTGVTAGTVSINSGSLEELDSLPRIGPVLAQRIIDYRNKIGGFKSLEEIKGVKGIGDKTYIKLLPHIRL
ncbi:MAG TPA: helix-hairpin-helix domain-containing protein [Fimbriimonadaceae bacterium]|nr:helix-hairpin-helix domain-containing protein [Fimbriimonadaceae bacterium]